MHTHTKNKKDRKKEYKITEIEKNAIETSRYHENKYKIERIHSVAGFWVNGDDCDSGLNEIWHICDDFVSGKRNDADKVIEEIKEWSEEILGYGFDYQDAKAEIEEILK